MPNSDAQDWRKESEDEEDELGEELLFDGPSDAYNENIEITRNRGLSRDVSYRHQDRRFYGRRPRRWWERLTGVRGRDRRNPGRNALRSTVVVARKSRRTGFVQGFVHWCRLTAFVCFLILGIFVLVQLMVSLSSVVWANDIQQVIADWGKPGKVGDGLAWYPTSFTRDIHPIPCHSHNDYWRRVPLFDALRAGCISVEGDVWWIDDDLLVGHDTSALTRNRTLRSLYINPIVDILERQNPATEFANNTKNGVFDVDPGQTLILLIDLKTNGPETWPHVVAQLEPLRERGWLTYYDGNKVIPGPVTVVGTGNTPFDLLKANETYRDYFFDAPLEKMSEELSPEQANNWLPLGDDPDVAVIQRRNAADGQTRHSARDWRERKREIESRKTNQHERRAETVGSDPNPYNSLNSYYASTSFNDAVGRAGWRGRLSREQRLTIRAQVQGAHKRGLKVRYWDVPSWPKWRRNHIWHVLYAEGVDMLNVDDLKAAKWW